MNSFRIATLLLLLSSGHSLQTPSTNLGAPGNHHSHLVNSKTSNNVSSTSSQRRQLDQKIQTLRGGSLSLSPGALQIAEKLAPKLGILTASALYLAPAGAVMNAVKKNDIGDLDPIPVTISSVVSVCWLVYGLSIQDPNVVLSNLLGCIGSIGFVFGILPLLRDNVKTLRKTQTVGIALSGATLCLWSFLGVTKASMAKVSDSLALFASGLFIVMSGSPLSSMGKVIAEKDSSSILGPLTVAQVINSSLWSFYGVAIKNSFVYGPNGIALVLGFAQLALKILYPANKKTA
ncbi:unnamed protein product [Cylindrotheca closterium]|uniref:Sugar transporter SWEET1 n=1 Tax=Cylindrotheca closterium TaxID=2856 RepID=A0AAD2FTD3_9STRA|nr:unnamed protein product [Cylindrotheca closterium]